MKNDYSTLVKGKTTDFFNIARHFFPSPCPSVTYWSPNIQFLLVSKHIPSNWLMDSLAGYAILYVRIDRKCGKSTIVLAIIRLFLFGSFYVLNGVGSLVHEYVELYRAASVKARRRLSHTRNFHQLAMSSSFQIITKDFPKVF